MVRKLSTHVGKDATTRCQRGWNFLTKTSNGYYKNAPTRKGQTLLKWIEKGSLSKEMENKKRRHVASLDVNTHTHSHICIHIYTHTHAHIQVYGHTHTPVHTHTHTYARTHTFTYTHTCIHTPQSTWHLSRAPLVSSDFIIKLIQILRSKTSHTL